MHTQSGIPKHDWFCLTTACLCVCGPFDHGVSNLRSKVVNLRGYMMHLPWSLFARIENSPKQMLKSSTPQQTMGGGGGMVPRRERNALRGQRCIAVCRPHYDHQPQLEPIGAKASAFKIGPNESFSGAFFSSFKSHQ